MSLVGQSLLDGRRGLDGHVRAAVVVPSEPQGNHRFVILTLLAVGVGQPRQPPDGHAEGSVEPFTVRSRRRVQVRVAAPAYFVGAYYVGRRVPPAGFLVTGSAELLDDLGEVGVELVDERDRRRVRAVAIGRDGIPVVFAAPILPYALSFAAGAMVYVVVEELIPESHRAGNIDLATVSLMAGFVVMMVLDVVLG
jgi:hypothetical protein